MNGVTHAGTNTHERACFHDLFAAKYSCGSAVSYSIVAIQTYTAMATTST